MYTLGHLQLVICLPYVPGNAWLASWLHILNEFNATNHSIELCHLQGFTGVRNQNVSIYEVFMMIVHFSLRGNSIFFKVHVWACKVLHQRRIVYTNIKKIVIINLELLIKLKNNIHLHSVNHDHNHHWMSRCHKNNYLFWSYS